MLLPSTDAARFLSAYKDLLQEASGKPLRTVNDYAEARNSFFLDKRLRRSPPTHNAELIAALKTACFGRFTVCRHMARHTEMIGPDASVYHVRGVTTELRELVADWLVVQTSVMEFTGVWICDGLIQSYNIQIGSI